MGKNISAFQGNLNKKNYFEGWYVKLVTKNKDRAIAFIPGVSLTSDNKSHSFIQYFDGKTGDTRYTNFSVDEFDFSKSEFHAKVGQSVFDNRYIDLKIDEDNFLVEGKVSFSNLKPYKKTLLSPGIMGFFSYFTFMECNHGLVSYDHDLSGELVINGETLNFDGGKGYMEKDWGTSMPTEWIWMQSNNFSSNETSFMFSIANIPFLGFEFIGFLGFFMYNNEVLHFATYTGAKVKNLSVLDNEISFEIETRKNILQVIGKRKSSHVLVAPLKGNMSRQITESLDSEIELKLLRKKDMEEIYSGVGFCSGLEVVGDISKKARFRG